MALENGIRALCAKFMKDPGAAWLRWGRSAHYVPQGLDYIERAAKLRNAEAQFELGLYCEGGGHGVGVKGKAIDHYRLAAASGHAEATFRMGEMLRWGLGIAADPEAGRTAYRRAAEMGWRTAAEWLAAALESGEGMEADAEMAAFWRRRAERLDFHPPSRSALLPMPQESARDPLMRIANAVADGLDQWMGEAIHQAWFRWFFWIIVIPCGLLGILALIGGAISFIGFAQFLSSPWVTLAFLSISFGAPLLLLLYFAIAHRRGTRWSLRGRRHQAKAERGDPRACYERGMAFLKGGHETPRDAAEARSWLRKAADGGHVKAMVELADLLRFGHGGLRDATQAKTWLQHAADGGHEGAKKALEELAPRATESL